MRYIFEINKLNQKDYELLGVSYYPFSPVKELSQLYSLGKFKNEPRPSAFKNTTINNKLSVSKETIEELEKKAFLYSQLKYEHEKLKNKFMPQLREIEDMLDSNPQDDANLKDFQIEFLLSELKKKDRNTDYRDLLKNLARSCNN